MRNGEEMWYRGHMSCQSSRWFLRYLRLEETIAGSPLHASYKQFRPAETGEKSISMAGDRRSSPGQRRACVCERDRPVKYDPGCLGSIHFQPRLLMAPCPPIISLNDSEVITYLILTSEVKAEPSVDSGWGSTASKRNKETCGGICPVVVPNLKTIHREV
ncbi:hypothetical protein FQA47_013930 [Oryzias melastigma]|uniref:Uncharacterized protein n=1 Tax=Oryzias melastigma TaxID=30732 RepID=A0A834CHL1_ORYME|nr:hypothetical protein FQA47_013930 [Oryzias melastigma]